MADYDDILKGGFFEFDVGPEKVRFTVHKKAVSDISLVLSTLMSNGSMQESTSGVAHLEDTDPQTFSLFAEYAYIGMYRIKQPLPDESHKDFCITCFDCNQSSAVMGVFSALNKTCPNCKSGYITIQEQEGRMLWQRGSNPSMAQKGRPVYGTVNYAVTGNMKDFRSMTFPALGKEHTDLEQYLTGLEPPDLFTEDVIAHAKLYVFSEKYMIDTLKDLCLHKLHRDLCQLQIKSYTIEAILDLLVSVYDNTSASDIEDDDEAKSSMTSTESTTNYSLRMLTMNYAIANAKQLTPHPAFEKLCSEGRAKLISDFTRGIAERLTE